MIKLGDIGRTGSIIHIDETDDLAGVTVQVSGASKGVNRLYARRLTACYRAMANVSTEWLEENQSIVVLGAPIADRFKEIERQRDELLTALVRADRKLSAYVGVCTGDKELTGAVLPMVREAIASARGAA